MVVSLFSRGPFATTLALVILALLAVTPVFGSNHLIDLNEIYTNADGTVQYVEMIALWDFQTILGITKITAQNKGIRCARFY